MAKDTSVPKCQGSRVLGALPRTLACLALTGPRSSYHCCHQNSIAIRTAEMG